MTAFFCFEGTAELPMGAEGFAAFSEADAVEHFFLITADAAAPSPIDGAETLGAMIASSTASLGYQGKPCRLCVVGSAS